MATAPRPNCAHIHEITVVLQETVDNPPIVVVTWPAKPTACTRANYPAVAATITKIIAESATALARWKAGQL